MRRNLLLSVFAALSTLLLAEAVTAAPTAATLPFPTPRIVQVTEATKCDFGTVLAIDAARGRMTGSTSAGPITYVVGPDVQVFSKEGRPVGGIAALTVGVRYRAYYVIDGGSRVLEIDLE